MTILTNNGTFFKSKLLKDGFDYTDNKKGYWCALCTPSENKQLWSEDILYQHTGNNQSVPLNSVTYYAIYFIADFGNDVNNVINFISNEFNVSISEAEEIYSHPYIKDRICYLSNQVDDYDSVKNKLDIVNQHVLESSTVSNLFFDIGIITDYSVLDNDLPLSLSNILTNNVFFTNEYSLLLENLDISKEQQFIYDIVLNNGYTLSDARNIAGSISQMNPFILESHINFNRIDSVVPLLKKQKYGLTKLVRDYSDDSIFRIPKRWYNDSNLFIETYSDIINPNFFSSLFCELLISI